MSTKEQPGPFDGMVKAAPDEPVFTLRAHDPIAPDRIHDWVELKRKSIRKAHADGEISDAKRKLELIQCKEAEEIAWQMVSWRKGEHATQADLVEKMDQEASYSGHKASDAERVARKQYEAIKRAVTLIQNGIAAINAAGEDELATLGMASEVAEIASCRDRLAALSKHIAPKRASYHPGQELPEPFKGGNHE